jgi:DNA-directed RNA polymerase beta' subunit
MEWLKVYSSPIAKAWVVTFDGDEMNMHCPQSEEAAVELEEIAGIPHNIVTPRHAKPLIGVFQDSLVGSYRLTRSSNKFTRREFMNLMMYNKRFDGTLPDAVSVEDKPRYTGQQVLSQLLPPLNIEMGNKAFDGDKEDKTSENYVKIKQGVIEQGLVDADVYMKPGKGIIHVTYNDYGPKDTVDLLDALQTTIESYLVMNGFSVGISDLIADDHTKEHIAKTIQERKKQVEEVIQQVHTDLFDNNTGKTNQQEFEDQIFGILNKIMEDAGKATQASLSQENRLIAMVKSGSKGDIINISQMIATLGQISVEGKRIPYGFTDRTLPHYKKYDDGAEARGFVESSFIRGLTPQEFFFHAMSGREGLIDTAVKTAETGYIQRQLIKAMEDLVVQHDGTVRDAKMNMVQFYYGEDAIQATKLEGQSLPLAKLTHEEIRREFGMEAVDWSLVVESETIIDLDREKINAYTDHIIEDQKMLVEGVFQGNALGNESVTAPVNLARLLLNMKIRSGINSQNKTDLTPDHVLDGIEKIIETTRSRHNKIWSALLRFHYAPHKLIVKERFTKKAFDMLVEMTIVNHMKTWVQPGEQVGIVAAQSIGEPSTQMSTLAGTVIYITNGGSEKFYGSIKDFIDPLIEKNKDKVIQIASDSVVLPLDQDYYIVGVSNDEKTSWKRISEVSRHPANGGIVEVVTRSGRKTTATLSHSFLKRSKTGIEPVLGSDLKPGMRIPIARIIPEVPGALTSITQGKTIFTLNKEFGWLCGIYLADGSFNGINTRITKIHPVVEEKLSKISSEYGWKFTTRHYQGEFGPGKDNLINSKDLRDFLDANFKQGSYKKEIGGTIFHCNKEFIAGVIGGYFDGDGNVNVERQQIRVGSRSQKLIRQINNLLGYIGIFGVISEETSVRIPDKVMYTLNVLKKYASEYKKHIGFHLREKAVALDEIITYMERDGKHHTPDYIDKIPELGEVIAETGRLLKMPGQSRTYGRWLKKESIGRLTLEQYVSDFNEMIAIHVDEDAREKITENMKILTSALEADIVWDEIIELNYKDDPKEYVYDFTVPGNDSFMVDDNVLVHNTLNTFHQAGVASKSNVTRGVPRLRELLKITKNPKATSLTIYLKPEYNQSKEKAREVVQDLELTLLRNITKKVGIYWDPSDEATLVKQDKELLEFFYLFEQRASDGSPGMSKWVLRLELDREEMFNKNISMADVAFVVKSSYAESNIVYSDYNSDNLVMRIRLPVDRGSSTIAKLDDYTSLKKFQNKLLNNTVIRGIPGIKAVTFRKDSQKVRFVSGKYEPFEQYILDTDGSNFIKVANHPAVDPTKLYTTNVHDIHDILGLEAVRAILISEMNSLFDLVGLNYRHLGLLCDMMTRTGRLMSADRYGINKNDIGPLAKMSFEETEKITLKAALFGEVDAVTGVSANVMTGQPFRGGTAFSQIMLDEGTLMELLETTPMDRIDEKDEEEEGADISDIIAEDIQLNDPCSSTQFQMNLVMPKTDVKIKEDDIEFDIIEEKGDD